MIFPISLAGNVTVEKRLSDISKKRAIISNKSAFLKKYIEKFGFFLKISCKNNFIKQWGYNR